MTRFAGRPWLASAFITFVIAAGGIIAVPLVWFIALPLGLAFLTLDMTRPGPPPPDDEASSGG